MMYQIENYREKLLGCWMEKNSQLIDEFDLWLQEKQLTDDTIRKHIYNIEFYINQFLLYEEAIEAKNGASKVGMFLGYWFIRKAMWASVNQIKSNAASLKVSCFCK